MTLVVLLILTEDDSFCAQINEVVLKKIDLEFYNEDQATANFVEIINLSSLVQVFYYRLSCLLKTSLASAHARNSI
jgi:hypothetical protein